MIEKLYGKKPYIIVITLTLMGIILNSIYKFGKDDKLGILNQNDSRNYMNINSINIPATDTTGAIPELNSNLIQPVISQNDLLISKLPIMTEKFSISINQNQEIVVITRGSNYKKSLLEFYSWLESNGYDRIDLSKIKINPN